MLWPKRRLVWHWQFGKTIIGEQVQLKPELVKNIAFRAMQEAVIGDTATITVNPEDLEVIQNSADTLQRIAGSAKLSVATDSSLTRGGCVIATDFGEVDASIEALLQALALQLGATGNDS